MMASETAGRKIIMINLISRISTVFTRTEVYFDHCEVVLSDLNTKERNAIVKIAYTKAQFMLIWMRDYGKSRLRKHR